MVLQAHRTHNGTCSDGLTTGNTTVVLTGLSSGTRYTFKAYSDSTCTDAKVLAKVSFTSSTPSNPTPPPVPPEISASAVTATTATLTIANYSGSWYYKRTAPTAGDHPYGSCSAVVSETSVEITGLSASTSYSFTAYSDGGCTAELATATLSTPAPAVTLTPSDTTATSLKLTIANHSGNWYYKHTIPSDGQCSSAVSSSTAVASGLQSSTSYIFKAYNDSGCNTVLATAAAINTLAPGAPAVTLTASDATATSLKLTIANHSGSWYYKYTTTSGGQCSNVASGTTAVASDLQSSTSYIFKAYSDSGCTTVLATAAATSTNKDPATQAAQKRVSQVAQDATPEVNRVVSATTANAVTQRVSQVVQGTLPLAGTQISWGNLPNTAQGAMELARRWAVDGETISIAALLDNTASLPPCPHRARPLQQRQRTAPPSPPGECGVPWTTDRLPLAQTRAPPSGMLRCSPPWWVLIGW